MFIEWNSPIGLAPEDRNVAGQIWDSSGAHAHFATPARNIQPRCGPRIVVELYKQDTSR